MNGPENPMNGPESPTRRASRSHLFSASVVGIVTLAGCGVESPVGPRPTIAAVDAARAADGRTGITEEPSFTPFDRAPIVINRETVAAAMERGYPALLRDAGVGGRAEIWLQVDVNGTVRKTAILESSGHPALDQAALRLGYQMRFRPAESDGEIVPVWVAIPVSYIP